MIVRTYLKNVRTGLAAIAALAALAMTACSAAPEEESSSSSSGGRFDISNEAARAKCSSTAQPSAPPAGTYATTAQVLDAVKLLNALRRCQNRSPQHSTTKIPLAARIGSTAARISTKHS